MSTIEKALARKAQKELEQSESISAKEQKNDEIAQANSPISNDIKADNILSILIKTFSKKKDT